MISRINLYRHPNFFGILSAAIVFSLVVIICWLGYNNQIKKEEQALNYVMSLAEKNVQQMLNSCYSSAITLALTIDQSGKVTNFEQVAAQLYKQNPILDVLQLVPDGVIQYTYPLEGNEVVIGYDILHDQLTAKEAEQALSRRELFFAGPFSLKQGGIGVVARLPIFIQDKFWGFSAVIIKIDKLRDIMNVDAASSEGYSYQFYKKNPNSSEVEYFIESKQTSKLGIRQTYYFEQGDWYLEIQKTIGWKQFTLLFILAFIGLIFSIISYFFVRNILKKPHDLQQLLDKQATKLMQREQKLSAILEALPDLLIVMDKDGHFLDYHSSEFQSTLFKPEQFLNKNISELMGEELANESIQHINNALKNNMLSIHSYHLQLPEGKKYFEARYVKMTESTVLLIIRNVTNLKTQMEKIASQNNRLKQIAWMQSHTVRAPLARIMGLIDMLKNLDELSLEEKNTFYGYILESAYQLDEIIQSIVDKAEEVKLDE